MAQWDPIQNSFSGGQVSPRMIMRTDADIHRSSVLRMENWMPTLQGSAVRTPGTEFLYALPGEQECRLIPYLTVINERVMVEITDQQLTIKPDVLESLSREFQRQVGLTLGKQIMPNPDFKSGLGSWDFDPTWFTGGDGAKLGCRFVSYDGTGALQAICRDWKYPEQDNLTCTVWGVGNVDVPTDRIQVDFRFLYTGNPGEGGNAYESSLKFGTARGTDDIGMIDLGGQNVGQTIERQEFLDLPTINWTGNVHVTWTIKAAEKFSTPAWLLDRLFIYANADTPTTEETDLESPYTADELDALQFVQSPHGNKELVVVHPNHAPRWLYYDPNVGAYKFPPIPFKNTKGVSTSPPEWDEGSYPAACTGFRGRLYLGGAAVNSETIWGSQVFAWDVMTLAAADPDDVINASSPLEFTTTFRSPIRWLLGHKDLMVGAEDVEYAVRSSQTVFSETAVISPWDIDARVETTHGSAAVQPVGFGQAVMFAAENGTKSRSLELNKDMDGWNAPDMTILAPKLLGAGIVRMVRMRNPHQMIIHVLTDGTMAALHRDSYAGIQGWSIINVNGEIIDAMVMPDAEGLDVLFIAVRRVIQGVKKLYVEAFRDWSETEAWNYVNSSQRYAFSEPTTIIDGLEHLEGKTVDVVANRTWVGSFVVTGGVVTLEDDNGYPITVANAVVGLTYDSSMTTLPPMVPVTAGGAGSAKRFSEIGVRVSFGSRPIINGERPSEREPASLMDQSQPISGLVQDSVVTNLGWDLYQFITIEESIPIQCEILGIYGKLTSESI